MNKFTNNIINAIVSYDPRLIPELENHPDIPEDFTKWLHWEGLCKNTHPMAIGLLEAELGWCPVTSTLSNPLSEKITWLRLGNNKNAYHLIRAMSNMHPEVYTKLDSFPEEIANIEEKLHWCGVTHTINNPYADVSWVDIFTNPAAIHLIYAKLRDMEIHYDNGELDYYGFAYAIVQNPLGLEVFNYMISRKSKYPWNDEKILLSKVSRYPITIEYVKGILYDKYHFSDPSKINWSELSKNPDAYAASLIRMKLKRDKKSNKYDEINYGATRYRGKIDYLNDIYNDEQISITQIFKNPALIDVTLNIIKHDETGVLIFTPTQRSLSHNPAIFSNHAHTILTNLAW